MLMSMTGFSRASRQMTSGVLTWEIKSVNHRFLDIQFKLPDILRASEISYRQQLQAVIGRGKVECVLCYAPDDQAEGSLIVNQGLVQQLAEVADRVSRSLSLSTTSVDVMAVLNWPGVLQTRNTPEATLAAEAEALLGEALNALVDMRAREGEQLGAFMRERLQRLRALVLEVQSSLPTLLEHQRAKIRARFEELQVSLDQERLEQEMLWLMQRMDVAEELSRLTAHVEEVENALTGSGATGRRLDFLLQEMHREANTLGSKSLHTLLTQASVEMKVLIEQMREQVQNIE